MRLTVVRQMREQAGVHGNVSGVAEMAFALGAMLMALALAVGLPYPLAALTGLGLDAWLMTAVDVALSVLLTGVLLLGGFLAWHLVRREWGAMGKEQHDEQEEQTTV